MELTVSERDYLLLEGRWGAIEKGQRAVTRGVIVPLVRISERVPSRSRREAAVAPASRAARGGWRRVRGRLPLLWLVPRQEALAGAQDQRVGVP